MPCSGTGEAGRPGGTRPGPWRGHPRKRLSRKGGCAHAGCHIPLNREGCEQRCAQAPRGAGLPGQGLQGEEVRGRGAAHAICGRGGRQTSPRTSVPVARSGVRALGRGCLRAPAMVPHSPCRVGVSVPSLLRSGSRTAEPSGESGSGTSRWTCARTGTCRSSAG